MYMAIMTAMISLYGCNKTDYEESQPFNGQWIGHISDTYYQDRYNEDIMNWFSEMMFYYGNVSSQEGNGLQFDYNVNTYKYKFYNFTWSANDDNLWVYYEDGTVLFIKNYSFTSNTLRGEYYDYNTNIKESEFLLNKTNTWVDYRQQPKYTEWTK